MTLPGGRVLHDAELVGTTFDVGETQLRLLGVAVDPDAPAVVLHHIVIASAGGTSELCEPDPRGGRWAIALQAPDGAVSFVCTSGAVGKCIRWGYSPWRSQELHEACVRMVRADYGGDGLSSTKDGTLIAFCDRRGVHPCTDAVPSLEAAWTPRGAACVGYVRAPAVRGLAELTTRYPQLARRGACTVTGTPDALLYSWVPGAP